ncbi:MAG: glycosyltransferase [Steroidobacteraceae bacterium]
MNAAEQAPRASSIEREPLPLGASIVLYRTPVGEIAALIDELLDQGAARVYLVDNSPLSFDTFGQWTPPERVTIIRAGRNLGYGRGHNIAISDSIRRHRYHVVSNPDIRLGKNVLRELFAVMEARSDVGLSMPEVVGPDGVRHYLCKRAPSPFQLLPASLVPHAWWAKRRAYFEMREYSYDREIEAECLSGCFMFLRSSILQRTGAFDERFFMYFEDFDLSRRVRRVARNLYFPAVHVIHEHRSEHRRSWRLLRAFGMSAIRYFSKWGWFEPRASREGRHAAAGSGQ